MCLDVFAKYIDQELKDKAIKILETFKQNTILSCIESYVTWYQETTEGSEAREIFSSNKVSEKDYSIIRSIDNRNFFGQLNNYSIDIDKDNKLIIKPNSNIISKFESLSSGSTGTFSFGSITSEDVENNGTYYLKTSLSWQTEPLLAAQDKFQNNHTKFLKSIIGTKCKVCNTTFIE